MRIIIRNISIFLLIALCGLSCSRFLSDDSLLSGNGSHRIILSGIVVDTDSGEPLEDIKITFSVLSEDDFVQSYLTKIVYTDNEGFYGLDMEALPRKVRCSVTAEDSDAGYLKATQELNVFWSGPSFDPESGIFFVNDCNFQLIKAQ